MPTQFHTHPVGEPEAVSIFVSEFVMAELIDHPCRRVPRQVVDKLVRTGYLPASKRHQISVVMAAWDRFKRDVDRLIGRDRLKRS